MWWLLSLFGFGVLGIANGILKRLKQNALKQRQRWEKEHKKIENEISNYERKIQNKIHKVRSAADFQQLTQLHFESMKIANHAYSLLSDARIALDEIGKAIKESGSEKNRLIAEKRSTYDSNRKVQLEKEINALTELRGALFPDKDKLKLERDHFKSCVTEFNANTRALKLTIRDRCGARGLDWYQRLEARTAARNQGRR
jgi:uncharacterized membrane-anchored protein YhcB (DUF1043 family)